MVAGKASARNLSLLCSVSFLSLFPPSTSIYSYFYTVLAVVRRIGRGLQVYVGLNVAEEPNRHCTVDNYHTACIRRSGPYFGHFLGIYIYIIYIYICLC